MGCALWPAGLGGTRVLGGGAGNCIGGTQKAPWTHCFPWRGGWWWGG